MKKQFIFAPALAMILGLGACSNDNEPQVVDLSKPIDLDFGIGLTTKVTIDDPNGINQFENGDAVGVYLATSDNETPAASINAGEAVNNKKFSYDGSKWDGTIYWQNTVQWHTLYGYYPYDAALDGTTLTKTVTVAQDQHANDGAGYKAADYLWAVNTPVQATTNAQTMNLEHRMARVVINLTPGADMTEEELDDLAPSLKILGTDIPTQGTFNVQTGVITRDAQQQSVLSEVTPYRMGSNGSYIYYAILLPGTGFTQGADFVSLAAEDGTAYVYKLNTSSNLQLEAGKQYVFTLQANKAGIDLVGFTIKGWQTGDAASGGADMVVQ